MLIKASVASAAPETQMDILNLSVPPEELGWVGAHSVMENDPQVIIYGCRGEWPMDIDWIRVWQK